MKTHDAEASAATYLAGVTSRRSRRRFEAHVLDCEECWDEVRLGRAGRRLAESARELAPQPLRERVRGAVSLASTPRIRWRRSVRPATFFALGASVLTMIAVQLARPEQPEMIRTLLGHVEEDQSTGAGGAAGAPRAAW